MNLITKKLRNITDEEFHDWSHRECDPGKCMNCVFYSVNCDNGESSGSWLKHKDMYSDKFLDQIIEVRVPDILTNEEKEYLSTVIKPYRDKITYIEKVNDLIPLKRKFIRIGYYESNVEHSANFPNLPNNEMYKGMKENKPYTLEELGL